MLLGTFELRIKFDYLHTHTCRVLLRLMPWTELFPARSLHRVHMYGSDNADVHRSALAVNALAGLLEITNR